MKKNFTQPIIFFGLFAALILGYSCKKPGGGAIAENVTTAVKADYDAFRDSVSHQKKLLKGHSDKEISDFLFHLINDDIYSYWQGTPWAFYGMSRTPREGEIACGYFVTNTLADLGFKIQRVKLAQCVSGEMIKALCSDIKTFSGFKKFDAYMKTQRVNSVYIVGLDYHTGYIVKDKSGIYFLHSNYIDKEGVVKEEISVSRALANNKFFMIGSLTANKKLLDKWISG